MSSPIELSMEQQFAIRSFNDQVQKMTREQAQMFLIEIHRQMIVKDAFYKQMLKEHWDLKPAKFDCGDGK